MLHKKYEISEKDIFDIGNYVDVENELNAIIGKFAAMLIPEKADIVISFLKDHSIKKKLVEQNATFIEQLTFSSLRTVNIEALFVACKTKRAFLADYEAYIRRIFNLG